MHHLLHHGRRVPVTPAFGSMYVRQALEDAALHVNIEKSGVTMPCRYLGACRRRERQWEATAEDFEPNPDKFPEHALGPDGWASHAMVW